jgi:hypothetical protein
VRDAVAGLDRDAEDDADRHRDEGRDSEPEQGLTREARGVRDVPQLRDARDDREEDERDDGDLQQGDVRVADRRQRRGEAVGVAFAVGAEIQREDAEQDAGDERDRDLEPERTVERLLGLGVRPAWFGVGAVVRVELMGVYLLGGGCRLVQWPAESGPLSTLRRRSDHAGQCDE